MKPNPLPFILERWVGVSKPTTDYSGRTVLVTGANTGLGFEAAATFASLNADRVVLAVRSMEKGEEARRRIIARGLGTSKIDVWKLDMGNFASVQTFAAQVEREMPRLDVAILNAGMTSHDYVIGVEGWESTLQVNVMSTALLGLLLLPKLRASTIATQDPSHLVIVASAAHQWLEKSDLPDLEIGEGNILQSVNAEPSGSKSWDPLVQNARSKLFAMYISESLAQLATAPNGEPRTIVTSICPGACKSELMRDLLGKTYSQTLALRIFDFLFNKPTEQGGWSYVRAASLSKEGHGKWYKTTDLAQPGEFVTSEYGKELRAAVWNEIIGSLAERFPQVRNLT